MKEKYLRKPLLAVVLCALLIPVFGAAKSAFAQSQLDKIRIYYDKRDFDKIIEEANAYLKTDPSNKNVLLQLAEGYLGKGLFAPAEETVRRALTLDPTYPWAIRVLARTYRERAEAAKVAAEKSKYLNSAKVEIEKALVYGGRDAWVNAEAALIYRDLGNKVMAKKAIETARSLSPNDEIIKSFQKQIQAM